MKIGLKQQYLRSDLRSLSLQGEVIHHDYKSNLELGKGRADCAFYITPEDIEKDYKGIVIEIKAATSDNNKKDFAQKALSQIEDKEYAKSYLLSDDSLVSVNYYGIAFFGKKCSVVAKTITRDDDQLLDDSPLNLLLKFEPKWRKYRQFLDKSRILAHF